MKTQSKLIACCRVSVRESDIFPLWLLHYGPRVDSIAVTIVAEEGDNCAALERLCRKANAQFSIYKSGQFTPGGSMLALGKLVRTIKADWALHVDSDEFLYEIGELRQIISELEKEGADHAIAWMADRLAFGGKLGDLGNVKTVGQLEAAFPVRAALTERLAKGYPYKVCLSKWPHQLSSVEEKAGAEAIHLPQKPLHHKASRNLTLEHFKWRTGLEARLKKRIKDHAASNLPWGIESQRILDELEAHGRIRAARWLAPRSHRIHGWMDYEDIYLDAVKNAPEGGRMVEIGVWQGRSLCFMAEAAVAMGKNLLIYGTDLFRNFSRSGYPSELRYVKSHSWLHQTSANLKNQGMLNYVNLLQARSLDAARMFDRESLDFVWIDGDHSYAAVRADINAWWPLVKPGGTLAGHDYNQEQVRRAVRDAGFKWNQIVSRGTSFCVTKPPKRQEVGVGGPPQNPLKG